MTEPPPAGLVLAGGRAKRLGGGDKPLRMLGGRTLLDRVASRLSPQCAGLALSANGDPARFAPWTGPVFPDHPEDAGCGPLAGLLAGFDGIAALWPAARFVLSMPGDTPFLPTDLAARLAEAGRAEPGAVALARSGGQTHPLAALWPLDLRHDLAQALRTAGVRRVRDWLTRHPIVIVDWAATPVDPFFNINTPDDLRLAAHRATDQ